MSENPYAVTAFDEEDSSAVPPPPLSAYGYALTLFVFLGTPFISIALGIGTRFEAWEVRLPVTIVLVFIAALLSILPTARIWNKLTRLHRARREWESAHREHFGI